MKKLSANHGYLIRFQMKDGRVLYPETPISFNMIGEKRGSEIAETSADEEVQDIFLTPCVHICLSKICWTSPTWEPIPGHRVRKFANPHLYELKNEWLPCGETFKIRVQTASEKHHNP